MERQPLSASNPDRCICIAVSVARLYKEPAALLDRGSIVTFVASSTLRALGVYVLLTAEAIGCGGSNDNAATPGSTGAGGSSASASGGASSGNSSTAAGGAIGSTTNSGSGGKTASSSSASGGALTATGGSANSSGTSSTSGGTASGSRSSASGGKTATAVGGGSCVPATSDLPSVHPTDDADTKPCSGCHNSAISGGFVFGPSGSTPLAGATVTIKPSNGPVTTAVTGSKGMFRLPGDLSAPFQACVSKCPDTVCSTLSDHQNAGDCGTCHGVSASKIHLP
jgi:hypothetical protein